MYLSLQDDAGFPYKPTIELYKKINVNKIERTISVYVI